MSFIESAFYKNRKINKAKKYIRILTSMHTNDKKKKNMQQISNASLTYICRLSQNCFCAIFFYFKDILLSQKKHTDKILKYNSTSKLK